MHATRVASRPEPDRDGRLERRWFAVWHVVCLSTLVLASGVALRDLSPAQATLMLALAVALTLWHIVTLVRHEPDEARPRVMLIYCVGMLPLFGALLLLHPAFLFVAFGLYAQLFHRLPWRWLLPVGGLFTALLIAHQLRHLGPPSLTGAIILALVFVTATLVALMLDSISRQSRERLQVIAELEQTRAELAAAERQAGVLAERERLAGEIHDAMAQGFASIVMQLEALEQAQPALTSQARRHLDNAREAARESLGEARRLVWALRPRALDGVALLDALRQVAARWAAESGVAASIEVSGDPEPLGADVDLLLLRAAQEGLANVRRHAGAHSVTLTLTYFADRCVLDVQDDGRGFALAAPVAVDPTSGGFGLAGLRARAAALGAIVVVESAPGEGTTLSIGVPYGAVRPPAFTAGSEPAQECREREDAIAAAPADR